MFKSFRDNRGKFSGQPGQPGQTGANRGKPGQTGANRGKPGQTGPYFRGKPGQTGANRGKPKKFTRSSPSLSVSVNTRAMEIRFRNDCDIRP